MITNEAISGMVEEHIRGTGIFLVGVDVKPGNAVRIYVDRPDGISIDECAGISRFLNERLDRDVEDYSLEVSSPGLGSPFRVKQQYEKNTGRRVEVTLADGHRLEGELESVSEQSIVLKMKGSSREIRFDGIIRTKEILSLI
jgi:ribosome maturation factor RimP